MISSVLEEVITRGSLALQVEDCAIRAAVRHRGERGGLVRLQNERFYQFIVWRAILPVWHAVVELGWRDLIVDDGHDRHHFEMKKWMTAAGETEIAGMKNDVAKLKASQKNGYLIVFSANPPEATDGSFAYLLSMVGDLDSSAGKHAAFLTEDQDGRSTHFWVAGWPISRSGVDT